MTRDASCERDPAGRGRVITPALLALGAALLFWASTLWAQGGVIELPDGGSFRYQNVQVILGDYQNVVIGEITNAAGRSFAHVEFTVNIHGRYGILIGTEPLVIEDFADGETRPIAVPTGIDIGQIRNISIALAALTNSPTMK